MVALNVSLVFDVGRGRVGYKKSYARGWGGDRQAYLSVLGERGYNFVKFPVYVLYRCL